MQMPMVTLARNGTDTIVEDDFVAGKDKEKLENPDPMLAGVGSELDMQRK